MNLTQTRAKTENHLAFMAVSCGNKQIFIHVVFNENKKVSHHLL